MRTVKMICTASIATSAAQTKKKGLAEQTMPSWDTDMQQLGFTQKPQRNYLYTLSKDIQTIPQRYCKP